MTTKYFKRKPCFCFINNLVKRLFSTEPVAAIELDVTVKDDIENNKLKPRKHPGVMKIGTCSLPQNIIDAVRIVVEEHPVRTILGDAKLLANYLYSRHHPLEDDELREKENNFTSDVKSRIGELPGDATEEVMKHYNSIVRGSVTTLMKKYNYRWSALDLHEYSCMVYLFTRAAPNYAAVLCVLSNITKLCPSFKPTTLFDFGSGVGSVSWAAKTLWGESLKEYMNIDSSSNMNQLAELIIKGGKTEADCPMGFYYRGFLPAQHTKYSLVVSSHSLMEMPSRDSRLNLLLNLWNKTSDFLVIIEQGTKPGFRLVLEARDFILSLANEKSPAHVLAPCPHDKTCPRFLRGSYPCHYQTLYFDLPVGKKQDVKKELFSYVIIRKGKREEEHGWPRVVRPVLLRNNHIICRICTSHGDLREIIVTKNKHGGQLYKCAKVTKWGDFLPVNVTPTGQDKVTCENQHDASEEDDNLHST